MPDPQPLDLRRDIVLRPRPPFHFAGTFCKPSYFPTSDILYEDGIYRQSIRFGGQVMGLRMEPGGSPERPEVQLSVFTAEPLDEAKAQCHRDRDPLPLRPGRRPGAIPGSLPA